MKHKPDDCTNAAESLAESGTQLAPLRHELRTPLNAIIGYSEMLLEDAAAEPPEFSKALTQIQTAGHRLLALLNEACESVNEASTRDFAAFGAALRSAARAPLDIVLRQSEALIETATTQNRETCLPDLKKIHAASQRLLALLDDLGRALRDNEALDFAVFPAAETPEAEETVAASSGRVLVVDDSEINRDILARRLQRMGHVVAVAENGVQALALLRAQAFDLVLLDILMPELNGYEVLRQMQSDESLRDIPVIVISATYGMESVVRCIEMGAADYLPKPFDPVLLRARVSACLEQKRLRDQEKKHLRELEKLNQDLAVRNEFIRQAFGRYISDELAESLLQTPEALQLGGELRTVTILMADLRGFTATTAHLAPAQVVVLLNNYLGVMVEVLTRYQGLIDEFIGDAILAIFGAPLSRADDAERAVACAIAMQQALSEVNQLNRAAGLPEVALGIGVNTGAVVAGNIGSLKRTKYGVIGSPVNFTARIESYTVGGQILISEATLRAVGDSLRIDSVLTVEPKGLAEPLTIYEVGGIGGAHQLYLPVQTDELRKLATELAVQFSMLDGKHTGPLVCAGSLVRLSPKRAELRTTQSLTLLSNLKLRLLDEDGAALPGELYGKVLQRTGERGFCVHFTFVAPECAQVLAEMQAKSDARQ